MKKKNKYEENPELNKEYEGNKYQENPEPNKEYGKKHI